MHAAKAKPRIFIMNDVLLTREIFRLIVELRKNQSDNSIRYIIFFTQYQSTKSPKYMVLYVKIIQHTPSWHLHRSTFNRRPFPPTSAERVLYEQMFIVAAIGGERMGIG